MPGSSTLFPASFRGVAFGIRSSRRGLGRRTVVHEFPQRDDPFVEDLGRLPRRFTLEAFVVGRDWKSRAEALEQALEQEGSGTLVHPWAGEVTVSLAGEVNVREGVDVGNLHVVYSIPFVKDSEPDSPTASPNLHASAVRAAAAASSATAASLDAVVSLAGGTTVLGELQSSVALMLGRAETAMRGEESGPSHQNGQSGTSSLLSPSTIASLAVAGRLGGMLAATYASLSQGFSASSISAGSWASSFGSADAPAPATPGTRAALAARGDAFARLAGQVAPMLLDQGTWVMRGAVSDNAAALARFEREAATLEAARAYAMVVPESRSEAARMRRQLVDVVDVILEETPSDAVYASFTDLRAVTVALMAQNAGQAPEIITVQALLTLPSLVLCHRHSRGITLETDFLARNTVRHPGFVPPGALEVVSRG